MRWATRGLEVRVALPPSENHLQGDFKNILIVLQDKSLITGNYGLPISPTPPPPSPSCKSSLPHPPTFILWQREARIAVGEEGAITWGQTMIMAADDLLHFHSYGVAHLWAAITDQMIQTGPSDAVAGLTE